jgi:AraC-like DNA-binding protein
VDGLRSEYVQGRPHPALARHVLRYVGYQEYSPAAVRRRQAPTGSCPLVIGFGPRIRLFGPAGPTVPVAFLAGMHDAPVVTEFTGHQHGLQADLTPLGVFTLLGRPMPELTNLTPALDDLEAPDLARLPAQLAEAPGWPQRFARLDAVLLRRLESSRARPDPEVAHAWSRLDRTGGAVRVQLLADETGWSRRHLQTRFRDQVGLTPKQAGRVLRFQRAARLLVPLATDAPAGARSITDVAAACGYADHAHLVREFRALAGCTPTEYRAGWS